MEQLRQGERCRETNKPKEYVRYTEKEELPKENYDKKRSAILWTFSEQEDVRYEIASKTYHLCGEGKMTLGTHTCCMNYFIDANLWETLKMEINVKM